jgi:hypothetical protein
MAKVNDSIFGSRWERKLFTALDSAWPGKLDIYANLPFLNVFNWSGLRISDKERSFLKATSIDYTVCLHGSDRPLMSVEFDGMGHGYNHGGRYVQVVAVNDPFRAEKLNLKLSIAQDLLYPFFVVSYDEAAAIVENDRVTITHGIVGDCVKTMHMQDAIDERVREIERMNCSAAERDNLFDDVVIDVETELDFEWNPLIRAAACSMTDALDAGMKTFSIEYLTDPPMPMVTNEKDPGELRRRVQQMFSATPWRENNRRRRGRECDKRNLGQEHRRSRRSWLLDRGRCREAVDFSRVCLCCR